MLSFFDGIRDLSFLSMVIRLLLSCACGTVIGLERSSKNRPAGFRTHILVCLSACAAALTGLCIYTELGLPAEEVSRISGQIITGLGFIGAGTIIVTNKMTIKGLTTAAGLWATGIIGLALGSGFFEGAIIGTVLVLLTETFFGMLSGKVQRKRQYVINVLYNEKMSLDHMLRFCKDHHMAIVNLQIQTTNAAGSRAQYAAEVTLRGSMPCDELLAQAHKMPGIVSAQDL